MHLNLPIFDQVADCQNILIAGMGGGYDIFCGLPIYFALRERGHNVHLANFSFANIGMLAYHSGQSDEPDTAIHMAVTADLEGTYAYFPELHLARWFRQERGEDVTIWAFQKTGVRPLLENYEWLVEHLEIDGIILCDGGVDSLMRGDEPMPGTLLEDSISLAAVNALKWVPVRLIACLGMGAEREVSHYHALENMAALTQDGAFLGACALVQQMEAYQLYEAALLWVQAQPAQESSVINSSVVSAVQGFYGNYHLTARTQRTGSHLWISPFMALYWFFDLPGVARHNPLLTQLRYTDTVSEALRTAYAVMGLLPARKPTKIPLP